MATLSSILTPGNLVTATGTETLTNKTLTAPTANDAVLNQPEIVGGFEEYAAVTSTSGSATLDLETANVFQLSLSENVTSFTWSNPAASGNAYSFALRVIQDSTDRSITWPAGVDWPAATAPTLSSGNGAVDVFVFLTTDAGTTWYGFTAGQELA